MIRPVGHPFFHANFVSNRAPFFHVKGQASVRVIGRISFFLPSRLRGHLFYAPVGRRILHLILFISAHLFFQVRGTATCPQRPPKVMFSISANNEAILRRGNNVAFHVKGTSVREQTKRMEHAIQAVNCTSQTTHGLLRGRATNGPFPTALLHASRLRLQGVFFPIPRGKRGRFKELLSLPSSPRQANVFRRRERCFFRSGS